MVKISKVKVGVWESMFGKRNFRNAYHLAYVMIIRTRVQPAWQILSSLFTYGVC